MLMVIGTETDNKYLKMLQDFMLQANENESSTWYRAIPKAIQLFVYTIEFFKHRG